MGFFVIIPASGNGVRFSGKTPKQFVKTGGVEILARTIGCFNKRSDISAIVISAQPEYFMRICRIISKYSFDKVKYIVEGAAMRQNSVFNGLLSLKNFADCSPSDRIIVHDAVRPFLQDSFLLRLMRASRKYNCVIPGIKLTDTVKMTVGKDIVAKTIPRENLRSVQTPQIFRYDELMKSFRYAFKKKFTGTDEAELLEHAGYQVKIIEGEPANIKITTKNDLKNK